MAKKIKGDIKYKIELDNEQQEAFKSIKNNQVIIITGDAGTGKSSVVAMAALDMIFRKSIKHVYVSRSIEEVGRPIGFLPGEIGDKIKPFIEPFLDRLYGVYGHPEKIKRLMDSNMFESFPVQFIRGKNIDNKELLIVEESQNLSKHEMLSILTRITKGGKIVILGDNSQTDTHSTYTGLSYAMELSNHIKGIKMFSLTQNHRSGIVKEIIEYERRNKNQQ